MPPEDAPPANEPEDLEPDDSDEPYGPEYLNWKPTTAEDFGPGEEMIRDMFFAFREELEEQAAAWEEGEAAKEADRAGKGRPDGPAGPA